MGKIKKVWKKKKRGENIKVGKIKREVKNGKP